jgi:hypothetical protein
MTLAYKLFTLKLAFEQIPKLGYKNPINNFELIIFDQQIDKKIMWWECLRTINVQFLNKLTISSEVSLNQV